MKYQCLIVDDERPALKLLQAYINKLPHLQLVASCESAIEAIVALQQHSVDILFLDIQMPELTGLELLRVLPNKPEVILTTAYRDYAVEGFALAVTDYLVKPFSLERFIQAVNKATDNLSNTTPTATILPSGTDNKEAIKHFFVSVNYKKEKVVTADILYIESMREYISIHTAAKRFLTNMSMTKAMETLSTDQFIRVHRSFIVALDHIQGINGNMIIIGEKNIPIGAHYREAFFAQLNLL